MPDQQKHVDKLKGHRVLIIGGSSGIGFGVAEACIENGCVVMISASSPASADKALQRLLEAYPSAKDRVSAFSCKLGDENTLEQNITQLFREVSASGKLDHVVFTAGDPFTEKSLQELSFESIKQDGVVRFFAPILVAKHAHAFFNAGPSSSYSIVSGGIAHKPRLGWIPQASFLSGHQGMARALALEMKPVRVNTVVPGAVDTEMWKMEGEEKTKFFEMVGKGSATGRIGRVEDVAESFIGIMKDRNCTASVIDTNSGSLIL